MSTMDDELTEASPERNPLVVSKLTVDQLLRETTTQESLVTEETLNTMPQENVHGMDNRLSNGGSPGGSPRAGNQGQGRFFNSPLSLSQNHLHRRLKKANSVERFSDVTLSSINFNNRDKDNRFETVTSLGSPNGSPRQPRHNSFSVRDRNSYKNSLEKSPRSQTSFDFNGRSPRDRQNVAVQTNSHKQTKDNSGLAESFTGTVKFPMNHRPRRGSRDDLDLSFRPLLNRLQQKGVFNGHDRPSSGLISPSIARRYLPSKGARSGLPPIGGGSSSRSPSISPRSPRAFLQPLGQGQSPRNIPWNPLVGNFEESDSVAANTNRENNVAVYVDYCIKTFSPQLERKATRKIVPGGSNAFQKVLENLDDDEDNSGDDDDNSDDNNSDRVVAKHTDDDGKLSPDGESVEVKQKVNHVHFSDVIEINGKFVKSPDSTPNIIRKNKIQ